MKLIPAAKAGIDQSALLKNPEKMLIDRAALALTVGGKASRGRPPSSGHAASLCASREEQPSAGKSPPSSQSRPSQRRSSSSWRSYSRAAAGTGRDPRPGSSICAFWLRAESQATSAQNRFPRCILPLGLGANRPRAVCFCSITAFPLSLISILKRGEGIVKMPEKTHKSKKICKIAGMP